MNSTLRDLQLSDFPQAVGLCANDLPGIAAKGNRAQWQLILAGGETGFWGGWQKVVFKVSRCHPYITLPRPFARAINMDVCRTPIRIQNEFYEELEAGVGLQGFSQCRDWCGALEGYERGVWPTMRDVDPANQFLRVYLTDPRDINLRLLVGPALDQNGNGIYTNDGQNTVHGFYLSFEQPFTTSSFIVTNIGGIQKDATYGDVLLFQVDATTGAEVLLSRYAPEETNPAYRRYFIHQMPCTCGPVLLKSPCIQPVPPETFIPVTAMVKLEFIAANRATDRLIIGNLPALIAEGKAIRYSDMDAPQAAALEAKNHTQAINLLNKELTHYLGTMQPAVVFAPFGTAKLNRPMRAVVNG